MESGQLRTVLRHLRKLSALPDSDRVTDGQLLERFTSQNDETAFELLLRRHGAMVYGVCRRLLGRAEDAEDAFQATFLVLVRKAAAVRKRDAVGSWLYKVAYRVALRVRAGRRAGSELPPDEVPAPERAGGLGWDLRPVLDEEVGRLPEKYRMPVVLCYLSGQTTAQAARQLGCPRGTVLSRLAWARQRLRSRLQRRGVTLSGGLVAAALTRRAVAAVPPVLLSSTHKAATEFAAGKAGKAGAGVVSARAVSLTQGVLYAMWMTKVKYTALVVILSLLGAALLWVRSPLSAQATDRGGERTAHAPLDRENAAREAGRQSRPLGTWERDVGPYHFSVRFEADRLYGTFTGTEKDRKLTVRLEADYSITKDSVVFGVITGLEFPKNADDVEGEAELSQEFVDQPFSFRVRVDRDVLTIKHLKFGKMGKGGGNDEFALIQGRYKNQETRREENR